MTQVRKAPWTFLALCFHVCSSDAYSFLLVPLAGGTSHCLEMIGIGRALHERGHKVHLLLPDFAEASKCVPSDLRGEINVVSFRTDPEKSELITSHMNTAFAAMASGEGGTLHLFKTLKTLIPLLCQLYPGAMPILDQLFASKEGSTEKLDMVVIDGIPFSRCLALVPAYLQTPFALTGSFLGPYDSNMPWPVTAYPLPLLNLPGRMNFGQRLVNTVAYSFIQIVSWLLEMLYDQGHDFGKDLADFDYGTAMKEAVLYLENSDYILDYAKATYPNFVQVGGLTTGPAKRMPDDLQKYFDSCKDGVVVISLGSVLYDASQSMADMLLTAAAMVKMNVVLRLGVEKATVKVPKHVKIVAWFPQNDALGHVNTRLFVSHCGKNGFFEGLYHGVPILCTPLNSDGYGTGRRVTDFGVGESVDLKTITAEELGRTMNRILEDPKIRENMKFYSTLFHERPETPGHRAASALEHVIKHGGDHLKPQTVDLNFVQYTGLDVFFVLMVAVLGIMGLLVCGCGMVLRQIMRRLGQRSVGRGDKGTKQQ